MCLATPMKIIKIEGEWAFVGSGKHSRKVNLSLVKGAEEGDYILVHGDMTINKIDKNDAEKILQTINNFNLHE